MFGLGRVNQFMGKIGSLSHFQGDMIEATTSLSEIANFIDLIFSRTTMFRVFK